MPQNWMLKALFEKPVLRVKLDLPHRDPKIPVRRWERRLFKYDGH